MKRGNMITLTGITKIYNIKDKKKIKVIALNDVNLRFEESGLVAVVGKSGSGKTTLLNMLGGLDRPTSGDVLFNGISLKTQKESRLDLYRNNDVSFIFQEFNLLKDYTVIENIKLACRLQCKNKEEVNIKALNALKLVSLDELADRKIETLSGGQQQRIAIARAIAKDSKIVLCDEPTGNLDSKTSEEIFEILKEIAKDRLVVVVTHDRELANKYANRVIVLSDGKITDDKPLSESSLVRKIKEEITSKKHNAISIKDMFKMIGDNLKKSILGNIIVLVMLIATIALTTVFSSLSIYNQQDALINTLKQNEQGIIQITKYIDYPRKEYDSINNEYYVVHGPVLAYEQASIDDLDYLINLTEGKAVFYKSYFFNKNLQDFTEKFIFTDKTAHSYEARCFREIVEIPDFSKFNMKVKYGNLPSSDNDVLIYDYMANNLIFYGICEGNIQDVVGKTLMDLDTGLTMKISGIIASDYELYSYIKEDNNKHEFEETYLTSLQTVFCGTKFIEELSHENQYSSVYKTYFMNDAQNKVMETNIKKLKNVSLDGFNFLSTIENHTAERGVIIDKMTVARILDIDVSKVNEEIAAEFLNGYYVSGLKDYYDYSIERNYLSGFAYRIIGVTNNLLDENILHWYTPNEEDIYMTNSSFRQFYLSLGKDWNMNKQILNKFIYQTHDMDFYAANPDYYFESYTDYISYGLLINDADYYLIKVKDFAQMIMIILVSITIIGLFFYAAFNIKKYSYKIGVLKALGAKNREILSIFGIQILLITLLAFALSIPVGYGIMANINSTFIGDINPNLVFFAINPLSIGIMFILTFIAVIMSISVPFLRLYIQTPINIIKHNNRK
jgi:ABC-type lipoprotein export system ATPase subunit/ABC-type antimicrobial peptide transport system permease subunit